MTQRPLTPPAIRFAEALARRSPRFALVLNHRLQGSNLLDNASMHRWLLTLTEPLIYRAGSTPIADFYVQFLARMESRL